MLHVKEVLEILMYIFKLIERNKYKDYDFNVAKSHILLFLFQEALAQAEAHIQAQSHSRPPVDPSELVPRLCHLVRSEIGYGFNLHSDRSRPGQYIRSLDPGSPADHAGLRPQDRLIEVGQRSVDGLSE